MIQWTVGEEETCGDIAVALYGASRYAYLVERYSSVDCRGGSLVLKPGLTLVVPAEVTSLATAEVRSMRPEVRAKPPGGGWQSAEPGMPLHERYSVNTREEARADIRFVDRTRIFLSEKTLVVIYGTARQSQVARQKEVIAELDSGELQAGLAAIAGKRAEIGVSGGAKVSAESRDTVLRKNAEKKRTTVSVFDGKAKVRSAGKQVEVPKNYGSAFVDQQAPSTPQPLPPPPAWDAGTSPMIVMVERGAAQGGLIKGAWSAIPGAVKYRVELATDPRFEELVVREEVGPEILNFRAEKMPIGRYYLRVRAIDGDDFLGIASVKREVSIVEVDASGSARLEVGKTLNVHRYQQVAFNVPKGLEVRVDEGPFGPAPKLIDFGLVSPKSLSFRGRGESREQTFKVHYVDPKAALKVTQDSDGALRVEASFPGIDDQSVSARMKPLVRVRKAYLEGEPVTVDVASVALQADLPPKPPGGSGYSAKLPLIDADQVIVSVVDVDGRPLGDATWDAPVSTDAPRLRLKAPMIGPSFSATGLHPAVSARMWSAQRTSSASVYAGAASDETAQLGARVEGSTGRGSLPQLGFDAQVPSNGLGEGNPVDTLAWLGASVELWQAFEGRGSMGVAARYGLPTRDGDASVVELGIALGRDLDKWSWLVNLGGRGALAEGAPHGDGSGFVMFGADYALAAWLRAYALLDAHVIVGDDSVVPDGLAPRGGIGAGVEFGERPIDGGRLFGTLGLRASAWDELDNPLLAQVGAGFRGF
ncbi:MAG: FecR domain-containing protein [Polyangiaceae bacterium]|nr:FecR domain-containing protein [Myxococcales bacterium]MCB9589849.1 FecR domain-containing protein [Polyangiaceae bacterium]